MGCIVRELLVKQISDNGTSLQILGAGATNSPTWLGGGTCCQEPIGALVENYFARESPLHRALFKMHILKL